MQKNGTSFKKYVIVKINSHGENYLFIKNLETNNYKLT